MNDHLFIEKLNKIRLLLLDVDGVLTDGSIIYDDNGVQTKRFNVKDGLGLRLLMLAGIQVAIATGRSSKALQHRCRNLGITLVFDGLSTKRDVLNAIYEKTGIARNEIGFVGDDVMDIPLMISAGVSFAVSDAHESIISSADIVTCTKGGQGAVREVCEIILRARGAWDELIKRFL